jgi:hypothetical protein
LGGRTAEKPEKEVLKMPFLLKARDLSADLSNVGSVLIVPCRFCPAFSFAVTEQEPYLDLFRTFSRTGAYEEYVQGLKSQLEQAGVRADVFDSKLPHHFVLCMWPAGRRQELGQRAAAYDAVVVLGCDSAVKTVQDATQSTGRRVISGMELEGLMSVIPSLKFPGRISLEVKSVTRVLEYPSGAAERSIPVDEAKPRT